MEELRAEFPVLERIAYLNAGTNGPVPRAAVDAVAEDVRRQTEDGRGGRPFFEHVLARLQELRGIYLLEEAHVSPSFPAVEPCPEGAYPAVARPSCPRRAVCASAPRPPPAERA